MKKMIITALVALTVSLSMLAQADLLVNLPLGEWNSAYKSLTPVGFSETVRTWASYSGPAFFAGASGTTAPTLVINTSTPDYLSASIATGGNVGYRVQALYMFPHQAATMTGFVYDIRLSGSGANQSNTASIVVRKTNGSYYISEAANRLATGYFTNNAPASLTWYNYDPFTSLTAIGSAVPGFQLTDINASGELVIGINTSTVSYNIAAGTRTFEAYGTIPEPATIGMLGLGALVAVLVRRIKS